MTISAVSATSATATPPACRRPIAAPSTGTEKRRMKIATVAKRTAASPDGITALPRFMSANGTTKYAAVISANSRARPRG